MTESPHLLIVDDVAQNIQILATMLVRLKPPFPVAMGVIYRVKRPRYEEAVYSQIAEAKSKMNAGDISKALYDGNTWIVE